MLNQLAQYSRSHLGVSWWVSARNTPIAEIPCFWAFTRYQSTPKGTGRKVLAAICKAMDRLQQPLCLWTVHPKLVDYYKAFSFFEIAFDTPNPDMTVMVRVPAR